jgi:hypothetical protein
MYTKVVRLSPYLSSRLFRRFRHYTLLVAAIIPTCPAYHSLLDFIILTILGIYIIPDLPFYIRGNTILLTFFSVPLHAMVALGGERRYSSYSFLTSAPDGGEWSASRPGRALPRRKDPQYPLYRRLSGPQGRSGRRLEEISFAGDRTPIARSSSP